MSWQRTVAPTGECGAHIADDYPPCTRPATVRVIDDDGRPRRTLCPVHAAEFTDSLKAIR